MKEWDWETSRQTLSAVRVERERKMCRQIPPVSFERMGADSVVSKTSAPIQHDPRNKIISTQCGFGSPKGIFGRYRSLWQPVRSFLLEKVILRHLLGPSAFYRWVGRGFSA